MGYKSSDLTQCFKYYLYYLFPINITTNAQAYLKEFLWLGHQNIFSLKVKSRFSSFTDDTFYFQCIVITTIITDDNSNKTKH